MTCHDMPKTAPWGDEDSHSPPDDPAAFLRACAGPLEGCRRALPGGPGGGAADEAVLLLLLRLLAIRFVAATGRLGSDRHFLAHVWQAYRARGERDRFAAAWLPALWAAC